MRPLLAVALLTTLAPAAPVPKSLKKPPATSHLVGTWRADNGSEWIQFDAEGGMKAWNIGTANNPNQYTYVVDTDPDDRPWQMTWTSKGQAKPSYLAVFVVDGDRMYMTYHGSFRRQEARPDPTTPPNYTRHTSDK